MDIQPGAQVQVLDERDAVAVSASASTKGRVILLSAKVEVRATAPGMLATQAR